MKQRGSDGGNGVESGDRFWKWLESEDGNHVSPRFLKVDHIGIAIPNLKEAVKIYSTLLGKQPEHFEEVAEQKAKTAFFAVGDTNLELLQSTSPEGPIGKFIEKNGRGGLHHICIQVENIEKTLEEYKNRGIQLIDEKPRIGAHGKKIAFVHPKSTGGILLELSEAPSHTPI